MQIATTLLALTVEHTSFMPDRSQRTLKSSAVFLGILTKSYLHLHPASSIRRYIGAQVKKNLNQNFRGMWRGS